MTFRYQARPVEVEAFQWDGGFDEWPQWACDGWTDPDELDRAIDRRVPPGRISLFRPINGTPPRLMIGAREGTRFADPGDWLVRTRDGKINAMKHDYFIEAYMEARDGP